MGIGGGRNCHAANGMPAMRCHTVSVALMLRREVPHSAAKKLYLKLASTGTDYEGIKVDPAP
jgi:hypothetical protein